MSSAYSGSEHRPRLRLASRGWLTSRPCVLWELVSKLAHDDASTSFNSSNISENLLALQAPSTSKCDLCQVSFCGIGVQARCLAAPLQSQHPHGMSDVIDLIQSEEVYECFDSNTVEVEFLVDYLTTQRLTPRHIYREVCLFFPLCKVL
jgi:hypothetical protein